MFGPGLLNEGNSVTRMVKWYAEGKWHFILGDGHAIGNYGFVSDVAKGHVQAMESGQSGERYLLGGENLSYNQFFEMLADLSQRRSMLIHVPSEVALAAGKLEESRGKWSRHQPTITRGWVQTFLHDWEFSSSKAERELGYRITPFREALSATLQWIALQVSLNIHKEEKCSCVPPSPLLAQ
jgi:farnesol dehydrogenase